MLSVVYYKKLNVSYLPLLENKGKKPQTDWSDNVLQYIP